MKAEVARDLGLGPRRERPLGVFAVAPQPAVAVRLFPRVEAELADKLLGDEVDQPLVPVLAAEHHVAVGRQGVKVSPSDLHHRDVERSAAKIVHQDFLALFVRPVRVHVPLLKPEGDRRGGRLVDDVHHLQARDVARVHRRLAADFVEVRRHGDHGLAERADLPRRVDPQLVEDPGLQRFGRIAAAANLPVVKLVSQIALRALGHVVGIGGRGFGGLLPDDDVAILKQEHARRDLVPFGIVQRLRPAQFVEPSDHRVGGSQVDPDGGMFALLVRGSHANCA